MIAYFPKIHLFIDFLVNDFHLRRFEIINLSDGDFFVGDDSVLLLSCCTSTFKVVGSLAMLKKLI